MAKPLKVEGPFMLKDADEVYKATQEPHNRERLVAVRMAQQGDYTLEQISSSLNRGRATIARWLKAYREGGVQKLLHRGHGGRLASLSKSHQDALVQGLRSGRWETTREIQAWLQKEQGVDLSLSGVYYWIYRLKDNW